jgi:hypothetical protein
MSSQPSLHGSWDRFLERIYCSNIKEDLMKKGMLIFTALVIILTSFFHAPTPAKALSLSVTSDKASGAYYADNGISISLKAYPGSTIVYTTDGSIPQARMVLGILNPVQITRGTKYTGPIFITGNKTIKAIALYNIFTPVSPVATFSYQIYKPTALANAVSQKFKGFNYNSYPDKVKYTANNRTLGTFEKRGITPINCTWYTFVRIQYYLKRSILFESAGGLNGKQWYGKIVSNTNQIKYSGGSGLENLIKANKNAPVYNIVVSFERNPGAVQTYGHVMLIDAIINGKVYYSDNSKPGVLLSNSIAAFKSTYYKTNGNIVGVVHLK